MINNPHPTPLSHRLNPRLKKTGLALAVLLATFLAACSTESSSTTPDTPNPLKPPLAAPQNLAASIYSATAVQLSWQAVSNATGYTVYYSSTQNFKVAAASSKMGITNLSTNVGGLTTGTAYYFRVKAVDSSNRFSDSPLSAEATATPAGLATPGKVKATNAAANSRALKWAPVTGATSYTVEYSKTLTWTKPNLALGGTVLKKENITGTNTAITGLEDVFYSFRVKAHRGTEESAFGPIAAIPRNKAQLVAAIKIKFTGYLTPFTDTAAGATEDLNYIDTGQVADFSELFWHRGFFNGDLSQWDTSKVTDMSRLFQDATTFNGDLSQWDTSKVTDMSELFRSALIFNGDLSQWDTSKVTTMSFMFNDAQNFNQDLSQWDTSKVTDMGAMFNSAQAFNQDISKWDISKVKLMSVMFYRASKFNQDISDWQTGQVTSMTQMFYRALKFNQDIGSWDTSKVAYMTEMFKDAAAFDQDLSGWDVSKVTTPNAAGRPAIFSGSPLATKKATHWPSAWR